MYMFTVNFQKQIIKFSVKLCDFSVSLCEIENYTE